MPQLLRHILLRSSLGSPGRTELWHLLQQAEAQVIGREKGKMDMFFAQKVFETLSLVDLIFEFGIAKASDSDDSAPILFFFECQVLSGQG